MSIRSVSRFMKCNLNTTNVYFRCFLTTDKTSFSTNAANKLKYGANFGAHCRAPHGKMACEDAFFIWNQNGIAAFGRQWAQNKNFVL